MWFSRHAWEVGVDARWFSPAVLSSVANLLLSTRTDLQTQRMLISQAYEIMHLYAIQHRQVRLPCPLYQAVGRRCATREPSCRKRCALLQCAYLPSRWRKSLSLCRCPPSMASSPSRRATACGSLHRQRDNRMRHRLQASTRKRFSSATPSTSSLATRRSP